MAFHLLLSGIFEKTISGCSCRYFYSCVLIRMLIRAENKKLHSAALQILQIQTKWDCLALSKTIKFQRSPLCTYIIHLFISIIILSDNFWEEFNFLYSYYVAETQWSLDCRKILCKVRATDKTDNSYMQQSTNLAQSPVSVCEQQWMWK